MKLGMDLDGVVYDFLPEFCAHMAQVVPENPSWKFYEEWGWDDKRFAFEMSELSWQGKLFREGRPVDGALPGLDTLHNAGVKIHVITHRSAGPTVMANTEYWLHDWAVPYESVSFIRDKTLVGVDLLVDDYGPNVERSLAADIPAVLFSQPWNRDYDLPRVNDWADLTEYVLDLAPHFTKADNVI